MIVTEVIGWLTFGILLICTIFAFRRGRATSAVTDRGLRRIYFVAGGVAILILAILVALLIALPFLYAAAATVPKT